MTMETAVARHLRLNDKSVLKLNVYLLNSRGGPWFSFSRESIEDSLQIPLRVESIDKVAKIIKFSPMQNSFIHRIHGKHDFPTTYRRRAIDRLQWCVKVQIDALETNTKNVSKNRLCTLIAPDTQLSTEVSKCSISTYDMQMFYSVRDGIPTETEVPLIFELYSLQCSYSFLFSRLDNDRHHYYGSWNVHDPAKKQHLLKTASDMGLLWSDRYWRFDLVLHWLTLGELDTAHAVIAFLIEHQSLNPSSPSLPRNRKARYYRSESLEFIS